MAALRILIVEDDPAVNRLLCRFFATREHDCVSAFDAFEALEILENQTFDLLVSDYNLPKMNGLDLVKHMERSRCHEVVLISGDPSTLDAEEIDDLQIHFLAKPIDFGAIETLLKKRQVQGRAK